METEPARYADQQKKLSIPRLVLIGLLHLFAIYALGRVFAPLYLAPVERSVLSTFSVTVTTPDEPETPEVKPDEGAAGNPGKQAVPKPVTAEKPKIKVKEDKPAPRASSTGAANTSGAKDAGDGTGAAGDGAGTGSGRGGGGQGGLVAVTKPVKISGDINSVRDFPIPEGGRQARFGNQVVVYMTVGVDGRASNCRVVRPSGDPEADRIVCALAEDRFRFKPATNAQGDPVPADYGWQQKWFQVK